MKSGGVSSRGKVRFFSVVSDFRIVPGLEVCHFYSGYPSCCRKRGHASITTPSTATSAYPLLPFSHYYADDYGGLAETRRPLEAFSLLLSSFDHFQPHRLEHRRAKR